MAHGYIDKEKIVRDARAMPVLQLSRKFDLPQDDIRKILGETEEAERVQAAAKGLVSLARVEAAFTKYLDQRHAPVSQRMVDAFMDSL
jgi:hypothetical protein